MLISIAGNTGTAPQTPRARGAWGGGNTEQTGKVQEEQRMLTELIQELEQEHQDLHKQDIYLLINGVSWQYYETLIDKLGNQGSLRLTYWNGVLEIVSPSRRHEGIKKRIATLLEVYFEERNIEYFPLGSTTLRLQEQRGGSEPDESYCIITEKEIPDLVIEVILTSGGVNKLEIYQRLNVPEVWFWQNNQLSIYGLQNQHYQKIDQSLLLPELDLELLQQFILYPQQLAAIQTFRQQLRR
ncbi:Uma2 family endonuclease [Planktothrix rubescens]|uniref:Uma2 family endonuclease n=1 Tax=Planktothrix rubescens TaxID=59512 RepID=UPI000428B1DB|nr:Uma2 family endonuclease [Planktothrix rubescens]